MVEVSKTQDVRLVDVVLLGPFMMWAARESRDLPEWARAVLFISGAATVAYNGRNYLVEKELEKDYA